MAVYSACVVVERFNLDSEEQNAALESLPFPAVVGSAGGLVTVDAEVPASSPADAILELRAALRGLGADVVRIDLDLVSIAEIADRLDVSRETARLWATGRRRSGFPAQFTSMGDVRLWRWCEVYEWAITQSLMPVDDLVPLSCDVVDAINGALAEVRSAPMEGWLMSQGRPAAFSPRRIEVPTRGWESVGAG